MNAHDFLFEVEEPAPFVSEQNNCQLEECIPPPPRNIVETALTYGLLLVGVFAPYGFIFLAICLQLNVYLEFRQAKYPFFLIALTIIQVGYFFVVDNDIELQCARGNGYVLVKCWYDLNLRYGASNGFSFQSGEYWRLISPVMMHANISHLASNLATQILGLWKLETIIGPIWTLVFYVLTACAASIGHMLFNPEPYVFNQLVVGASGAIYGLIGVEAALLALFWFQCKHDLRRHRVLWCLVALAGSELYVFVQSEFEPMNNNVSHSAHAIGFITGFLLLLALSVLPDFGKWDELNRSVFSVPSLAIRVVCTGILTAFTAIGLVLVFNNPNGMNVVDFIDKFTSVASSQAKPTKFMKETAANSLVQF